MGMFDYVHFEMDCPKCGALVTAFQSKDAVRCFDTIEPDSVLNFYCGCWKCNAWIDFSRLPPPGHPLREASLTYDEIVAMGFVMSVSEA